jgi:predicted kinase
MPRRPLRLRSLAAMIAVTVLASATAASTAIAKTTSTSTASSTVATSAPSSSESTPASTSATTTTMPAAKPRLALFWRVLTHQCWTTTKAAEVKTKKRVKVGTKYRTKTVVKRVKKPVRQCGERPSKAPGRVLHLHWRQHGEVFGNLTLAGQPIANAIVTIQSAIPHGKTTSTSVVTNAHGRFSSLVNGPNKKITLTYSPGPGTEVLANKNVRATAAVSLKVGHLRAGGRARFSGIVFGGHIPQDLYIQFWYYAGPAGWQPFSHLAIVHRHNGHWSTDVSIPGDSRGYRYEIRAAVVASPDWPWSRTTSRIVTRIVS